MSHLKFQSCITACYECAVACTHCESACLDEQDVKMCVTCIKLDHDCAAICFLAVEAMASGSQFAKQICKLCAEICTACANECEKHAHLEHCKACAVACRKCAEECSKM
jgi:hypothetical protein